MNTFVITLRQGNWRAFPEPPLPAGTHYISLGWEDVAGLREDWDAIEVFESAEVRAAFENVFGEEPGVSGLS